MSFLNSSLRQSILKNLTFLFAAFALSIQASATVAAAPLGADIAGGKDHPLLQRYTDSWLAAYQQVAFDGTTFPTSLTLGHQNEFASPVLVEGKITRLLYVAPLGKSAREIHRNYAQALTSAGLKPLVNCTPQEAACENLSFGLEERYRQVKEADFQAGRDKFPPESPEYSALQRLGGPNMLGAEDKYFTYGTLSRNGDTTHLLISTGKIYASDVIATYVEIAEPKPMLTGQVTVNVDALQSSLKADGKIALYGIYFDTGKAEVKAESDQQLAQIAELLKNDPSLRILLVGHTDNQGTLENNLALSQKRASSVATELTQRYGIEKNRITPKGVANLAPVAANSTESGRAKNRRVELVLP